jgi:hypothetical protein
MAAEMKKPALLAAATNHQHMHLEMDCKEVLK